MSDDKIIQIFKIFACTVLGIIIGLCALFFIGISKVDAANAIGGYNTANDTGGVWWKESDLDYSCGTSVSNTCGNFDRALAILYNFQPSTSDTLTFNASISTTATYMSNKTWNSQVYVLWGYGSNLYYNWTLQDSCTIDSSSRLDHLNSITDRKTYSIDISCTASPPVSGAYPVIYVLQRYSNDTWGGLSNYNFNAYYVAGTISASANNSDIISADNQNTQKIIENDNKNTEKITDSVDENTNAINDLNDNMTDPTIDSSSISGFSVNEVDTGLTGLITLPLTTINNLLNQTCSPIVLPLPFINKNLTLPCLTPIYQEHFPSILNLWQMVITAIIGYWIAIKVIAMVKGFTDPDDDRIEVLDL